MQVRVIKQYYDRKKEKLMQPKEVIEVSEDRAKVLLDKNLVEEVKKQEEPKKK
jgi:hypothetical protein